MPEAGEILQGSVVGGRFRLNRYLGGSQRSAVFLTERHQREPKTAVIKLIPADPASADLQLSRWKLISQLSHPHLLQLFEMGRCEHDGVELIFVVMEYAEENLAEILSSRPLTPDEAGEMLRPTLEALAYLHDHGFVHGHLKPANIMVVGEQLKLSCDGICQVGEADRVATGTYGAPELPGTKAAPPQDIWSLGVTLVQVLTLLLPVYDGNERQTQALTLPEPLPPQFLDLVRNCLERDPERRPTVPEIAEHVQGTVPGPTEKTIQWQGTETPRDPARHPRYAVPAVAVVLTLIALLGGVKSFNRQASQPVPPTVAHERPQQVQPPPATFEQASPQLPKADNKIATTAAPSQAQPPARAALKTARDVRNVAPRSLVETRTIPTRGLIPGHVVQQVLPDVLQSASNTIRGTVRVTVRVRVDPAGNVSGVSLVSSGPSQYFARLALDAARSWKFSPAQRDGQSVPSVWTLRFEFIRGGTRAIPVAVS